MSTNNLKSEDGKPKVCRVCLERRTKVMFSLFEPYKNIPIFQHISAFVNVKIIANDGLPDQICSLCFSELEAAINFKEKCESSDQKLHKNINENLAAVPMTFIKEEGEYEDVSYLECNQENDGGDELAEIDIDGADIKLEMKQDLADASSPLKNNFPCSECNQVFKSQCKLRVHKKKNHNTFTCEDCRRQFKSLFAFNNHKAKKTQACRAIAGTKQNVRIEGIGKSRVFHCTVCNFNTTKINYMRIHTVVHSGEKPYACNLCPNRYSQQSGLVGHKETAHGEYRVEITCDFCGKMLKGRDKAYKHLQTHSSERYQCDICKKFLKNKKILSLHLLRHTGIKDKICEICGAAFFTQTERTLHKKTKHRLQKFLKCSFCAYEAKSTVTIIKHEKKHAEFNFACSKCGEFFMEEYRFNIHKQKHIDGKIHECNLCEGDVRFKRKVYLVTHMKRYHADHAVSV